MMSIIDFCSIRFPKKKSIKKGEKKHNGPKPSLAAFEKKQKNGVSILFGGVMCPWIGTCITFSEKKYYLEPYYFG